MGTNCQRVYQATCFIGMILLLRGVAEASQIQIVSAPVQAQSVPAGGNGDSVGSALSTDGRFALFAGTGNNLALNPISSLVPTRPRPLNHYVHTMEVDSLNDLEQHRLTTDFVQAAKEARSSKCGS
jgi:hypothetical protein